MNEIFLEALSVVRRYVQRLLPERQAEFMLILARTVFYGSLDEYIIAHGKLKEFMEEEHTQKFEQLVKAWMTERFSYSSDLHSYIVCPAYLSIIAMGSPAVPLILEELRRESDFWFAALKALTGANPVRSEHQGYIELMRQDWLQWGVDHDYLDSVDLKEAEE